MDPSRSIRVGGCALILGAISFVAVLAFLAARFDYPAVLDGPASTVLPKLLATGVTGRAVWAVYAVLPLVWIPAGVGAYYALRNTHPGAMLLARRSMFSRLDPHTPRCAARDRPLESFGEHQKAAGPDGGEHRLRPGAVGALVSEPARGSGPGHGSSEG